MSAPSSPVPATAAVEPATTPEAPAFVSGVDQSPTTDPAPEASPAGAGSPTALEVAAEPSSLAMVFTTCDTLEAWAETVDSIPAIKDNANKLAAWDEYLARTSKDGRARVAATMRRLEVRIGGLLGPAAPNGGNNRNGSHASDPFTLTGEPEVLTRNQRRHARALASDPETVEDVIASSTDEDPASARKVFSAVDEARTRRIFGALKANPTGTNGAIGAAAKATPAQVEAVRQQIKENPDVDALEALKDAQKKIDDTAGKMDQSAAGIAARVAKAKAMAAEGYTSRQIATALGYASANAAKTNFGAFKRKHGIEVPADAGLSKTRLIDPTRVIGETVSALEGLVMALDLIDPADADPTQYEHWANSLSSSLRSLNRLSKQLKEMTQ